MKDELKDAIAWARRTEDAVVEPYRTYRRLLADAAERSMELERELSTVRIDPNDVTAEPLMPTPDMSCPACGAPVDVDVFPKGCWWICPQCNAGGGIVGTEETALADLAWWQDAARLKREKEGQG